MLHREVVVFPVWRGGVPSGRGSAFAGAPGSVECVNFIYSADSAFVQ